eukprot:scaffold120536_cov47-Prasinocladus_malaysianus.AAC.1
MAWPDITRLQAATESELQGYKAKVAAMEQETDPASLSFIERELEGAKSWRRDAKKALEETYAALPGSRAGLDTMDSAGGSTDLMEVVSLREENAELSAALAEMSVKFAEADSMSNTHFDWPSCPCLSAEQFRFGLHLPYLHDHEYKNVSPGMTA